VADRLADMRGGRIYAYLSILVKRPSDFSVAANEARRRIAEAEQRRAFERRCALFRERFRGTVLTNRPTARKPNCT
jgi:hypothetical protein